MTAALDLFGPADPAAAAAAYRSGRYVLVIVEERGTYRLAGRRIAVAGAGAAQRWADRARAEYPADAYRLQVEYVDHQHAARIIPTADLKKEHAA